MKVIFGIMVVIALLMECLDILFGGGGKLKYLRLWTDTTIFGDGYYFFGSSIGLMTNHN